MILFVALLAFLFLYIGTAAGDFFCPNLNAIATMLGLSENITGVTFLALGNGSPDLFATFSALQQKSYGLAIGELLGAGSFITTCVVGSIAIITGFQVTRRPFLRDVLFFLAAITIVMVVLSDEKVTLVESLILIALYFLYVFVVVVGRWIYQRKKQQRLDRYRSQQAQGMNDGENALIEQVDQLLASAEDEDAPLLEESSPVSKVPQGLFVSSSIANNYDPWFFKHKTLSSLHSGHESRKRGLTSGKKPLSASIPLSEPSSPNRPLSLLMDSDQTDSMPKLNVDTEDLESPNDFNFSRRRSRFPGLRDSNTFRDLFVSAPSRVEFVSTMLPIFDSWSDGTIAERGMAIISIPSYMILGLTVPVVDDAEEDSGGVTPGARQTVVWKRWLFIIHAFVVPVFACWATDSFSSKAFGLFFLPGGLLAFLSSCLLVFLAVKFTSPYVKPKAYSLLSFAGFVTSVLWIYVIANELLAVMQAIGVIMRISEAILGLTVFAIGNSISDLISDVSVAKMGFPNMAIAACFGAPMLNILLGIGVSTFYYNVTNTSEYHLKFTPTLYSSSIGLLISLLSSAIIIPLSGWKGKRTYGIYLICVYVVVMIVNVSIELSS